MDIIQKIIERFPKIFERENDGLYFIDRTIYPNSLAVRGDGKTVGEIEAIYPVDGRRNLINPQSFTGLNLTDMRDKIYGKGGSLHFNDYVELSDQTCMTFFEHEISIHCNIYEYHPYGVVKEIYPMTYDEVEIRRRVTLNNILNE